MSAPEDAPMKMRRVVQRSPRLRRRPEAWELAAALDREPNDNDMNAAELQSMLEQVKPAGSSTLRRQCEALGLDPYEVEELAGKLENDGMRPWNASRAALSNTLTRLGREPEARAVWHVAFLSGLLDISRPLPSDPSARLETLRRSVAETRTLLQTAKRIKRQRPTSDAGSIKATS